MAWNIPGGSGKDGRNPRQRSGPAGLVDRFVDPLRGLFGGGSGGITRWIGVLLALWLVFNCFVLITEQQRGVVLRFGQFARVLQPGPHLKWPWPVEHTIKVNATQSQAFNDTVPVLTLDGNMVAANKADWLKIERLRLGKIDRSVYGYAEGRDNLLVFDRFDDRSDQHCPQGGTCVFDPRYHARAVQYQFGADHLVHSIRIVQSDGFLRIQ